MPSKQKKMSESQFKFLEFTFFIFFHFLFKLIHLHLHLTLTKLILCIEEAIRAKNKKINTTIPNPKGHKLLHENI